MGYARQVLVEMLPRTSERNLKPDLISYLLYRMLRCDVGLVRGKTLVMSVKLEKDEKDTPIL